MRSVGIHLCLTFLLLGPVAWGQTTIKLSPLAEALEKLYLARGEQIISSNPISWDKDWYAGKFDESDIRKAIEEIERQYPEEVAKRRLQGRQFRSETLASLNAEAKAMWGKYPPLDPTTDVSKALMLFLASQKAKGMGTLPPHKLDVIARDRTLADPKVPLAREIPVDQWGQHFEIRKAYAKHRRQAEEELFANAKSSKALLEEFEVWRKQQVEFLDGVLAKNLGLKAKYLSKEFPFLAIAEGRLREDDELKVEHLPETAMDDLSSWVLKTKAGTDVQLRELFFFSMFRRDRAVTVESGDRIHLGYGYMLTHPYLDGALQYVEGLNHANAQILKLRMNLSKLSVDTDKSGQGLKLIEKGVKSALSAVSIKPEAAVTRTTYERMVPGAESGWMTEMAWARMKENPRFFESASGDFLFPRPHFSQYRRDFVPSTKRELFRRGMTASILAASIVLGHFVNDIVHSQPFQIAVEKSKYALNYAAEKGSNAASFLAEKASGLASSVAEKATDAYVWAVGAPTDEERLEEELQKIASGKDVDTELLEELAKKFEQSRSAESEQGDSKNNADSTETDSNESGEGKSEIEKAREKVEKALRSEGTAIRDHENSSSGKNHPKDAVEQDKQSVLYRIETSSFPTENVPTRFKLGVLSEVKSEKSFVVPNNRPSKNGYYFTPRYTLSTGESKVHIPTNAIVILPRPEDALPKSVDVEYLSEDIKWRDLEDSQFEVRLTEKGTLFLKLGDKARERPIRLKLKFEAHGLVPEELKHSLLENLDRAKLAEIQSKMHRSGLTKTAERLGELLNRPPEVPITIQDLSVALQESFRYSYQPGAVDETIPLENFDRYKGLLDEEGNLCIQCTPARDVLLSNLINYFGEASPIQFRGIDVLIRQPDELHLPSVGHVQVELFEEGNERRLVLDSTPSNMDPRDTGGESQPVPPKTEKETSEEELVRLAKEAQEKEAKERLQDEARKLAEPLPSDNQTKADEAKPPSPSEPATAEHGDTEEQEKKDSKTGGTTAKDDTSKHEKEPEKKSSSEHSPSQRDKAAAHGDAPKPAPQAKAHSFMDTLREWLRGNPAYFEQRRYGHANRRKGKSNKDLNTLLPVIPVLKGNETPEEVKLRLWEARRAPYLRELRIKEFEKEEAERLAKEAEEAEAKRILEEKQRLEAERIRAAQERASQLAAAKEQARAQQLQDRPMAPKELIDLVESNRSLLKSVSQMKLTPQSGVPYLDLLRITNAAESFLLTGEGLDVFLQRAALFLGKEVEIGPNASVSQLLKEVRAEMERRLDVHVKSVTNSGAMKLGRFAEVHSPLAKGRMADTLEKLENYPWGSDVLPSESVKASPSQACHSSISLLAKGKHRYSLPRRLDPDSLVQ
jgi:hypothetical protein